MKNNTTVFRGWIFLTSMLWATVQSAPINNEADATILNYDYQLRQDGYSYTYSTSNGITRKEEATIIPNSDNENSEDVVLRVNGYYEYTAKDNRTYRVNYVADEDGYRIQKPPKFTPKVFTEEIAGKTEGISSAALASLGGK